MRRSTKILALIQTLREQIQRLPNREDREAVVELSQILLDSTDPEEMREANKAMVDIADDKPVFIVEMDFEDET